MKKKWSTKGAHAPLFDRLSDFEPHMAEETEPFITLTTDQMKESIQRECTRILNTRCNLTKEEYFALEEEADSFRFPQFFGLPDGTYANPKNSTDSYQMERMMSKAIEIFEPRLQNVRVAIQNFEESKQALFLSVEGDLMIGNVVTPISFPISLEDFQEQGDKEKSAYDTRPRIELNKEL